MPDRNANLFLYLLASATVLTFLSCAPQTETVSLPVETPDTFSRSGTGTIPQQWWTTFEDEQLDALVDTALENNFNLKTSWQRLKAANAVVDRASSNLLPDLEGSVSGAIERPQPDFVGGESIRLGLSSVYEVDLWGRINSQVEAAQYRARATRADYQTAALSLSAEITRTWYQLAEAQNQLNLIDRQIQTNEQVLQLLENRLGTGQIRSVDLIRQRQLVESTREQKTYAQSRAEQLEHRLAVLLGQSPQDDIQSMRDSLPALPPLPEAGVPIELVQRRPDVQAAFNYLKAADRDLATAISNQYPRLTISATASLRANNLDDLFGNFASSLAGDLLVPIFYGGRLDAEVDRNEAIKQQRLFEYGQTVLTAFREVENALTLEQNQRESIRRIEEQIDMAQQAYEQLRVEYFNGTSDYLDVLTALNEIQTLRRDLLSAKLNLVEYRIALYRALAGSFETNRETEDEG